MAKPDKDAPSDVCWPIGDPVDLRSVHERGRTQYGAVDREPARTRYPNRRGSFVMIPSTPIALSLAICVASSTVQAYS
jgi:hypothetical protein